MLLPNAHYRPRLHGNTRVVAGNEWAQNIQMAGGLASLHPIDQTENNHNAKRRIVIPQR